MNTIELSQEVKDTFFKGMSDEAIKDYQKATQEIEADEIEQFNKDNAFIEELKGIVTPEYFEKIKYHLIESDHTKNYRFVEEPIGDKQNEGDCFIWVDQSCGACGDDYYGTVCMRVKDRKYFIWDYWM